jgi:hypothetical protein
VIGHGSGKAGSHGVHGAPLGAADLKQVKTKFGFNPEEVSDALSTQCCMYSVVFHLHSCRKMLEVISTILLLSVLCIYL